MTTAPLLGGVQTNRRANGAQAQTQRLTPSYLPEQTLLCWLGRAARKRRDAAGVSMVQIAALLGMNTTKGIERFERAEHMPLNLEVTLAAYGEALGLDPRELLADALIDWQEHGSAPTLSPAEARRATKKAAAAAIEEQGRALARSSGKAKRARSKGATKKKG